MAFEKQLHVSSEPMALHGLMGWAASNNFGRCGRIPTAALKLQQYGQSDVVRQPLAQALAFAAAFVDVVPPREVRLLPVASRLLTVYSDAEYTPESGRPPRLGWVVFDGSEDPVVARTLLLDPAIPDQWKPRQQQIFPAESFAPLAALLDSPGIFANADVRWFIDNEAACSTLIRGASREEDVSTIAELTHLHLLRLSTRVWFEWIDSESNPSDGLSRLGLACPLFGAQARTAAQPDWRDLSAKSSTYLAAAGFRSNRS